MLFATAVTLLKKVPTAENIWNSIPSYLKWNVSEESSLWPKFLHSDIEINDFFGNICNYYPIQIKYSLFCFEHYSGQWQPDVSDPINNMAS